MSLPESFTIFSPKFSLFETFTPTQYLAQQQGILETLPKWQEISGVISIVAFAVLFLTGAVVIVLDEDQDADQSITYQFFAISTALAALTFTISALIYASIPLAFNPILSNRVEWLQAGLAQ